jgi:putative transposase
VGVKRKQHSAEFKARVALAGLSGERTLTERSAEFGVHPTMISNWKQELVKRAGELFGRGSKAPAADDARKVIDDLHRKDRATAGRVRFSCRAARHLPSAERRAMIAPKAGLSVSRQCALLGIARGSFYYRPRPESAEQLELLKRLDRIFTRHPVYGSRRLQVALLREGISVGRRRVRRLMRKLALWAVRPRRNTSKRHPGHKVYPYLLRGKTIDRANQVWAADITYIPLRQGFLSLVAIIDWATRRVLSWRLSNTLAAGFCVEALSAALARFGTPDIVNTDQGEFTSEQFTNVLRDHRIAISMDGRGRCHDNIFVERLWWTVKHEWVYLRPAADGIEQKRSLGEFFDWYNLQRPHQALGWRTPDEAYLGQSTAATALAA